MSDPVQQADVEDVLSSIRRLVSDGSQEIVKPVSRPKSTAPRLVLTPALRVSEGVKPAASNTKTQSETNPDRPASQVYLCKPGHRASGDTDAPWQNPEAKLFDAAGVGQPAAETSETVEHQEPTIVWRPRPEREALQNAAQKAAAVVQKLAELEAASGAAPQESWEPAARTTPPFGADLTSEVTWDTESDAAEKETPSDTSAAEIIADPRELQDDVEERTIEKVAEHVEETLMDEDALREMVTDIVRQELQGALGERITRNVRKLVHREIQRALAARDLL